MIDPDGLSADTAKVIELNEVSIKPVKVMDAVEGYTTIRMCLKKEMTLKLDRLYLPLALEVLK